MQGIEWIVFDLGGVVLEVDQRNIFKGLAECTEMPADVVRARLLADKDFWGRHGTCVTTDAEFHAVVSRTLGVPIEEEHAVAALNAELGDEIESTVTLMQQLKPRYKLACLSNTNSTHWRALVDNYPCMQLFDKRLASQEMGLAKPDPEMYRRAATLLAARPERIIFIDDKLENVEGARDAGWHAHHYVGDAELRAALAERGVVIE